MQFSACSLIAGFCMLIADVLKNTKPMAAIHQVMGRWKELVGALSSSKPKIVRMCGDERFTEVN